MFDYLHYLGIRDAAELVARIRQSESLRQYLADRARLVLAALAAFALVSVACAAATLAFVAQLHGWLALPALLLAPLVFVGSLFVQSFVFLSWLEQRAVALALGRPPKNGAVLPAVPWLLAVPMFFVPFILLASLAPDAALLLVALLALVPLVYLRLEPLTGAREAH